jgi:hypothetical protein
MKYLLPLLLLLFATNHVFSQKIRPEISAIVKSVIADGFYDNDDSYFNGEENKNSDLKKLSSTATNDELIQLLDHKNPIIRAYSFEALAKRTGIDLFPFVLKLLHDTTKIRERPSGCIPIVFSVGEIVSEEISPAFKKSNIELTPEQFSAIDSFILYSNGCSHSILFSTLKKIQPIPKFYARIKELYVKEKNKDALAALAKYRKPEDKQLIIDVLKRNEVDEVYFALWAVINFPDQAFYPYLKSIHNNEIHRTIHFNRLVTNALWQAIVQYKTKESREMMEKALATVNTQAMEFHGIDIYLAIEEYPDPVFDGIQDKIHLSGIQQMEVMMMKKIKKK